MSTETLLRCAGLLCQHCEITRNHLLNTEFDQVELLRINQLGRGMVEYFGIEGVPKKVFFRCERMRATLSTESCSAAWRRADELNDGLRSACRLCPIGAVHAGEVAASMSPLKGTLTCARCHRTAGRLIGAMICVSCYNRQREVLIGKNAKGTAPVKLCALNARRLRYRHGDEILSARGRHTVDADELLVAVLRDSKQSVVFAFNSTPPAAVRQARLW